VFWVTLPAHLNSPWAMGVPYGIGHLLIAGILQFRPEPS